jgi:hypothetical protein
MSDRTLSRRVRKLGASVETDDETARRQRDLLRRLEETFGPRTHEGLRDCGPDHCGLVRCSAGCCFSLRRRWLINVLAAVELFQGLPGPLYEVRIFSSGWQQALGELSTTDVAAAKQFVRRRIAARTNLQPIIIGQYKVGKDFDDDRWIGEFHCVVAGMSKVDVRSTFRVPITEKFLTHVEPATDLAKALVEVLRPNVGICLLPFVISDGQVPKKAQRAEFYRWLLRLGVDERLFR